MVSGSVLNRILREGNEMTRGILPFARQDALSRLNTNKQGRSVARIFLIGSAQKPFRQTISKNPYKIFRLMSFLLG